MRIQPSQLYTYSKVSSRWEVIWPQVIYATFRSLEYFQFNIAKSSVTMVHVDSVRTKYQALIGAHPARRTSIFGRARNQCAYSAFRCEIGRWTATDSGSLLKNEWSAIKRNPIKSGLSHWLGSSFAYQRQCAKNISAVASGWEMGMRPIVYVGRVERVLIVRPLNNDVDNNNYH